jgi:hypothetical protein
MADLNVCFSHAAQLIKGARFKNLEISIREA